MMRRERGASALFVVVVVLLAALVVFAVLTLFRSTSGGDSLVQTKAHLELAASALEQYTSTAARLPCPANPSPPDASTEGIESRATPTTCTYPQGVIPWRTIGMRQDDALDGWGRKISYRVWTNGATGVGSVTQDGGASMVNCDTVQAFPPAQPVDATLLCPTERNTLDTSFITGKGFQVTDFGTTYSAAGANGAAFVLISHGASGLGAYTASGTRRDMPTAADELSNTTSTGPFVAKAANGQDPAAAAFFDDVLVYRTVADVAKRANLAARDWPDVPPPDLSAVLDASTVAAALGAGSVSPGDTGRQNLAFGDVTIYGFNGSFGSPVAQDLSFDEVGGSGGLGVAAGGSAGPGGNLISSAGNEFVGVAFARKERWFAVTLGHFGIYDQGGKTFTEQVDFTFLDSLGRIVGTVRKSGCRADGGLASFAIDVPGGEYDIVAIKPAAATEPGGSTGQSALLVSEVAACLSTATACQTSLATSANNCP
jgi:type II secretory pathway pseudopilin PulG